MRLARLCVVGCGLLVACSSDEGDVGKIAGSSPEASTANALPTAVGSVQSSAGESATPVTSTTPTASNPLTSASVEQPPADASAPTDAEYFHPLWMPHAFGPVLDAYVDAVVGFTVTMCLNTFCDRARVEGCVYEEAQLIGHPEWLACVARLPAEVTEDYFRALTENWLAVTLPPSAACFSPVMLPPKTVPPPELEVCDALDGMRRDDAVSFVRRCDGNTERADGADERNCDPTAAEYDCGDGSGVPWLSWCDATEDCSNGADEAVCGM